MIQKLYDSKFIPFKIYSIPFKIYTYHLKIIIYMYLIDNHELHY